MFVSGIRPSALSVRVRIRTLWKLESQREKNCHSEFALGWGGRMFACARMCVRVGVRVHVSVNVRAGDDALISPLSTVTLP